MCPKRGAGSRIAGYQSFRNWCHVALSISHQQKLNTVENKGYENKFALLRAV